MLPNFLRRKNLGRFDVQKLGVKTGRNAAQIFGREFFGNSISVILVSEQDKMLPNFGEKIWGVSMFRNLVTKQDEMLPNFVQENFLAIRSL